MPGYRQGWEPDQPRQVDGSEFGGVQPTLAGGIQPKGQEAIDAGDKLRLGYLTGVEDDTNIQWNLEDRRQMMGLRPASGARPLWLDDVSPTEDPRLQSEARRQGYGE